MKRSIIVRVDWDDEAKVWVATSDDIGLVTEAETQEALEQKAIAMILELLALNEQTYSDLPDIPIHFMAEKLALIPNPRFQ
jgi:uncharacterized protein DUF1902